MGILDGDVAQLFSSAFGGMYLDGTAHSGTRSPVYVGGRITGYTDAGDVPIKVQTDSTSAQLKQTEGYEVGDVLLIILAVTPAAGEDPAVQVVLNTDAQITDGYADRYRLMDCDQDAARSHWICRGRPV